MNPDFEYPRESVEYVFLKQVTANGITPEAAEFNMTPGGDRPQPAVWQAMDIVDGRFGFLLGGNLPAGEYTIWVRIPEAPELSIIEAGRIRLT